MRTHQDALNLTARTIDRRAFHFRNLVVLLVLVAVACVLGSLVAWSGWPFVGLLAILPLCGGYLVLDNFQVNRWREKILEMWASKELDLDTFARAMASLRMLPAGTVGAMLATLPTSDRAPDAARLTPAMKRALADTVITLHSCASDPTKYVTLAYFLVVASLTWAALQRDWVPLLGCLVSGPVLLLGRVVSPWRLRRRLSAAMRQWQAQGLDLPTLVGVVGQLKGEGMHEKQHLLNTLSPKPSS
jgi:hypothetical protein